MSEWHSAIRRAILFLTEGKIIALSYLTVIITTKSHAGLCIGLSTFGCVVSAKLAKLILREPRPAVPGRTKTSYGMPSTHSSAVACASVLISSVALRTPLRPSLSLYISEDWEPVSRAIVPFVVLPIAWVICATRVWKGHHTVRQVIGGFVFGTIYGLTCFKAYVRFIGV